MKITIDAQDSPHRIEVGVAVFKSRLEVLDFMAALKSTAEMIWPPHETSPSAKTLARTSPTESDPSFGRVVPRGYTGDGA